MNETSFHQSNNLYPDASISKKLQDAVDDAAWKAEISAKIKTENASLGKDANVVGVERKTTTSYTEFRLLSAAQKIMKKHNVKNTKGNNHRTRNCHACRSYQAEKISLKLSNDVKNSKASLSGLQTCSSVWTCPVCARRIKIERAKEIKKALDWAKEKKHTPIMITVTASHHKNMSLREFKKKFKIAWRKFGQSTVWRRLRDMLEIKNTIKATEITFGTNGFHYHYHGLLFVPNAVLMKLSDEQLETWKKDVSEQWIKCLKNAKLSGKLPYACNISAHGGVGAEYLSKLGLEDAKSDAQYELTSGDNKDYKGRSIWWILKKAKQGVEEYENLYVEFAEAMQNEYFTRWTDNFKALVGADDLTDEEICSSEEKPKFEEFMTISDEKYSFVRKCYAIADLLSVAADTRDKVKVYEFLDNLKKSYFKNDRDKDILRLEKQYLSLKQKCFEQAAWCKQNPRSKSEQKKLEFLIARRDGVKNTLFELQKNSDLIPF